MISEILITVVTAFIVAVPTAAAVYGALRKELEWQRSDIKRNQIDTAHAHSRIDDHVSVAHMRKVGDE